MSTAHGVGPGRPPTPAKELCEGGLQTLVLGKTVQIKTTGNHYVSMSLGGMDIGNRLLSEGVALIEENSFLRLPMARQQQLIAAQEHARQYRRGLWQQQRSTMQQRFHYPAWPADRLPSPFTNAPVYRPDTN